MNAPSITNYVAIAKNPDLNPHGTGNDLAAAIESVYADWSTTGRNPLDSKALRLAAVKDMGSSYTGGIGVFVETPDHPGGNLDILHSFHQ